MTRLEQLEHQFELLGAQFELLRDQFKIVSALQMFERFHAFDAINNDACPCCGGRVAVIDNGHGTGIKLEAVS